MKNIIKTITTAGMIFFLLGTISGCKGKSEEEEIEKLVEKLGEAKTEKEAAEIAEKIEKLEERAKKKSTKEIIVKLGESFTFWQKDAFGEQTTRFSITFERTSTTKEHPFAPNVIPIPKGKKHFAIIAKIKNLGPRETAPEADIELKVDKGYIYDVGAFGELYRSPRYEPSSLEPMYRLEPGQTGWRLFCSEIPEDTTPIEILGTLGGSGLLTGNTKFRMRLAQEKKEIPLTRKFPKDDNVNYLQFPLRGDWKPIRGFNVWSSDWCGRHLGEDVERNPETPIYPMTVGIVKFAQYQPKGGIGYGVIIEHDFEGEELCSVYYHMREPKDNEILREGQSVLSDKPIGYVSGESKDHLSIPHLHFGIRKGKYKIGRDPRTNRWYYPGYTAIYNEQDIRQNNERDTIHNEIIKEWIEPSTLCVHNENLLPPDKPESKPNTVYDVREQDNKRLQSKPVTEPQFRKLNSEEEIEAERLWQRVLNQRKMGRLPATRYNEMVDTCREIIHRWPESEYAFKAKRTLSDLPEKYQQMHNVTKEELDISGFYK